MQDRGEEGQDTYKGDKNRQATAGVDFADDKGAYHSHADDDEYSQDTQKEGQSELRSPRLYEVQQPGQDPWPAKC